MRVSDTVAEMAGPPEPPRAYRQRFSVPFEYAVCFTRGLFERGNGVFVQALSEREPYRRHRFVVFIDANVARSWPDLPARIVSYAEYHRDHLELAAAPETVPGGEEAKSTPDLVARLQHRLMQLGIDRHSYVVAVGGGAMLDMVGYVAATTHRGVRLVRVPTTVLAQNDSGVGVKNGLNAFGQKNFVGTFAPPHAVLNDLEFVASLAPRDKRAGMSEAVKVGLIRDAAFFTWLESHAGDLARFEPSAMDILIRRCAELHMRHIAGGDPFEMGSARPLDFGHWSAHKLEMLTGNEVRHGEAVAIGIALDSRYSAQVGMLVPGEEERICRLLERLGFRLWHPALEERLPDGRSALLTGLEDFRAHLGGELTVTLLAGIGRGIEVNVVDSAEMLRAVDWLRRRGRQR